jgi:pSer/pThr/pTyr-binding forkhead associated (FHA) protein
MNSETILISALVGIVTSAITAYVTTRLRMKEERQKWQRDFSIRFTEAQSTDDALAHKMAMQFGIGFLKYRNLEEETQKAFVPPNCRLIVGRHPSSAICIGDPKLSRYHCAFVSDDENVFIESLGATVATLLNGSAVEGRRKLKPGDVITAGRTEFLFYKLDSR